MEDKVGNVGNVSNMRERSGSNGGGDMGGYGCPLPQMLGNSVPISPWGGSTSTNIISSSQPHPEYIPGFDCKLEFPDPLPNQRKTSFSLDNFLGVIGDEDNRPHETQNITPPIYHPVPLFEQNNDGVIICTYIHIYIYVLYIIYI